ncbi:MAG: hypothetical protein WB761_18140 [Solirubrobacteraceae bacterium]
MAVRAEGIRCGLRSTRAGSFLLHGMLHVAGDVRLRGVVDVRLRGVANASSAGERARGLVEPPTGPRSDHVFPA